MFHIFKFDPYRKGFHYTQHHLHKNSYFMFKKKGNPIAIYFCGGGMQRRKIQALPQPVLRLGLSGSAPLGRPFLIPAAPRTAWLSLFAKLDGARGIAGTAARGGGGRAGGVEAGRRHEGRARRTWKLQNGTERGVAKVRRAAALCDGGLAASSSRDLLK